MVLATTPATIEIPAFDFTAFYYADILEALLEFKRLNVPELTDESPQEPLIQLLRAFALVGHLNNTLVDLVANECTLPTARLVETVRNMLRLIDFEMRSATPAQVDVVFELAQVILAATEVIPDNAQVATTASGGQAARVFETLEGQTVTPTNAVTRAIAVEDGGGGIDPPTVGNTDVTTEANTAGAGNELIPWTTPVGGSATREGDSLMFGHAEAMFDEIDIALVNPASEIVGVWEYYDGNPTKRAPTSVTDLGVSLRFDLTDYLGTADLRGTPIRVRHNPSGAFEDLFSDFVGGVNVVTSSLLGQSSPSTDARDYTIGSVWERFTGLTDDVNDFATDGVVSYDLPQTLSQNWSLGTFFSNTLFWVRYRIITVGVPAAPEIDRIRIDTGTQYLKRNATQGQTQSETLGSGDGTANQSFLTSRLGFIQGSEEVTVSGVIWQRVDNFLASRPTDRHYRVQLEEDDRARIIFGDGAAGAAPPAGVNNISITYRHGATDDGNVGAQTVKTDKTGLSLINSLFNPRAATGWDEAQGASEASLERAKIEGPASLRIISVALGPQDVEVLAARASAIDPTVITVSRSRAIEEGFGPKTIELVVVPAGGALASQAQLDALTEFFNGNRFVSPVLPKRIVANQEVTAVNYTPRTIDISATVRATGAVTATQIVNALTRLLQPEARTEDGVSFEWRFGELIPHERIAHEIFAVDSTIKDVNSLTINGVVAGAGGAGDVQLLTRELPDAGTLTITVQPA